MKLYRSPGTGDEPKIIVLQSTNHVLVDCHTVDVFLFIIMRNSNVVNKMSSDLHEKHTQALHSTAIRLYTFFLFLLFPPKVPFYTFLMLYLSKILFKYFLSVRIFLY